MSEDAGSIKLVCGSPARYAGPPAVVICGAIVRVLVIILDVSVLELLKLVNGLLEEHTRLKVFIFLPILVIFLIILVVVVIITGVNFIVTLFSSFGDKIFLKFTLLAISRGFIRGQTDYPNLKEEMNMMKLIEVYVAYYLRTKVDVSLKFEDRNIVFFSFRIVSRMEDVSRGSDNMG